MPYVQYPFILLLTFLFVPRDLLDSVCVPASLKRRVEPIIDDHLGQVNADYTRPKGKDISVVVLAG